MMTKKIDSIDNPSNNDIKNVFKEVIKDLKAILKAGKKVNMDLSTNLLSAKEGDKVTLKKGVRFTSMSGGLINKSRLTGKSGILLDSGVVDDTLSVLLDNEGVVIHGVPANDVILSKKK